MTQAVQEVILRPMEALYPPPTHLRANPENLERALAAYETALARFDRDTLQRGWDHAVAEQEYWCWPSPATLVAACRLFEPRQKPPSEEERRQQQALGMADAYATRYMKTSHVARLARQEGWAGRMREYVYDVAFVQAQLICKAGHIRWNANLADGLGNFHSSQDAFAAYRKTVAKAVAKGQIRVTVPAGRIRRWKEEQNRVGPEGELPEIESAAR
jgi:hypothetical protein